MKLTNRQSFLVVALTFMLVGLAVLTNDNTAIEDAVSAAINVSLVVAVLLALRGDFRIEANLTAADLDYRPSYSASRSRSSSNNPLHIPPGCGPLSADMQHAINELWD